MAAIQINIDLDGYAFQVDTGHELALAFEQILAKLATVELAGDREVFAVRDSNGNRCGQVELEDPTYNYVGGTPARRVLKTLGYTR